MNDLVPSIGSSTQTNSAVFLAEDAVSGIARADQRPHRRLGAAIGDGDRAQIGLVVDRERLAEVGADDIASRIGQRVGKIEKPVQPAGVQRSPISAK
jgi:hypothetical protein